MKKGLCFLLIGALLLCFTGCQKNSSTLSATGEYNGQTITMSYQVTDVVYPQDMRSIPVVNGYAPIYDASWYESEENPYPGDTWNVIDRKGNLLFKEPYLYVTHFNAEGKAAAKKHDGTFVLVTADGNETPISEQEYQDFKNTYDRLKAEYPSAYPEQAGSAIYQGLVLYVKTVNEENNWDCLVGLADTEGNVIIPAFIPIRFSHYTEHLYMNEDVSLVQDFSTDNIGVITIEREDSTQQAYRAFLEDLKHEQADLYYSIKDIDGNGVDDLIVNQNTTLTVYTLDDTVKQIDEHDFITGTARFFYSDDKNYPGIFYLTVGGGANHFGYMTIKDQKLVLEDLWEENYASESPNAANSIKELSSDKALISESKEVYTQDGDIDFTKLQ